MLTDEQKARQKLFRSLGALILGRMAELSIDFDDLDNRFRGVGSKDLVLNLINGFSEKLSMISDILFAMEAELHVTVLPRKKCQTNVAALDKKTDEDIAADAAGDPDAAPIDTDWSKGEIVRPQKHLSSYEEGYEDGIHAAADSLGGEIKHITLGYNLINSVTQENALALMNCQRLIDIEMIENLTKVKE